MVIRVWRHPRPQQVAGRCVGQWDAPIDARKAKRLAHRIRQQARRQGLARIVFTSPLRRSAMVGRYLRAWGWRHVVDAALSEASFGAWDGRLWSEVPRVEVDAWVGDFLDYSPGGGDSLRTLLTRAGEWQPAAELGLAPDQPHLVVGHAGWMLARRWVVHERRLPAGAHEWPAPPSYGHCWVLD